MRPRPTKSARPCATRVLRRRAAATPADSCSRSRRRRGPGSRALSCAVAVDLPRHAAQRVLGRQVAVARREERRPLHVRVVVRAARGDVDPAHAQLVEQPKQLRARPSSGVVEVAGRPAGRRRRRTLAASASGTPRPHRVLAVGHRVEGREPHADRAGRAPSRGCPSMIVAQEARAVLEASAVAARRGRARSGARGRGSRGSA